MLKHGSMPIRELLPTSFYANISVEKRAATWLERLRFESDQSPFTFVAKTGAPWVSCPAARLASRTFRSMQSVPYVKPSRQNESMGRMLTRALVDALIERKFSGLIVGILDANEAGRRLRIDRGTVGRQSIFTIGDESIRSLHGWPEIHGAAPRQAVARDGEMMKQNAASTFVRLSVAWAECWHSEPGPSSSAAHLTDSLRNFGQAHAGSGGLIGLIVILWENKPRHP
jgi:hypothetical protein